MPQTIQIKRTITPDSPPATLAIGELAVELASNPIRLWVGVPTTVDPLGRRLLNPGGLDQATADGLYVNIVGDAMTGPLTITPPTNFASLLLNRPDTATGATIQGLLSGGIQWQLNVGKGANGDFVIDRFDDTQAFISSPLSINRATGLTTLIGGLSLDMAWPYMLLDKSASGEASQLIGALNGVRRWHVNLGNVTVEGGANSGSDLEIARYDDAGVAIDYPLMINRATGVADFTKPPTVLGVPIGGSSGGLDQATADALYVNITGDTMTGDLYVDKTAPIIALNSPSGSSIGIQGGDPAPSINLSKAGVSSGNYLRGYLTGAGMRWEMSLGDTTAEGGTNTGSNFALVKFTDAGLPNGVALSIDRATSKTAITGSLDISCVLPTVTLNDLGTQGNRFFGSKFYSNRWAMHFPNANQEYGANSGSDFMLERYDDLGVLIDSPLTINRASGVADFTKPPTVLGVPIGGGSGGLDQATADTLYVNVVGDTMTGPLLLNGTVAGDSYIGLASTGGFAAGVWGYDTDFSMSSTRWGIQLHDGSLDANFAIWRHDDTGAAVSRALAIDRATGDTSLIGSTYLMGSASVTGMLSSTGIYNTGALYNNGALTTYSFYVDNDPTVVDAIGFIGINKRGIGSALIRSTNDSVIRWELNLGDWQAESGGNTGTNFTLTRFDDAGLQIDAPITIPRATGVVNFTQPPTVNGVPIGGGSGGLDQATADTLYVNIAGDRMTGALAIENAAGALIQGESGATALWQLWLGNASQNFEVTRFDDTLATWIGALSIDRATGNTSLVGSTALIGDATVTGTLVVNSPSALLSLQKAGSGYSSILFGYSGGLSRWTMHMGNSSPETGANLGSDFSIERYDDAGLIIDSPVTILRATGVVGFIQPPTVNGVPIAPGNFVLKTGDTMTGDLRIASSAGFSALFLDSAAAGGGVVQTTRAGLATWNFGQSSNAEGTFYIQPCDDLGLPAAVSAIEISRANSATTLSGYLKVTGNFITIDAPNPQLYLDKAASGNSGTIVGRTNLVDRWHVKVGNATPETGANVGSDFEIIRLDDAGAIIGTPPLTISRATGDATFSSTVWANFLSANNDVYAGFAGATGKYLFGNTGGKYLQYDGVNFGLYGAPIWIDSSASVGGTLSVYGQIASVISSNPGFFLNKTDDSWASVFGQKNGVVRWRMDFGDGVPETGANAGSNFSLNAFDDAGASLYSAFSIPRATGVVDFGFMPTVGGVPIGGAGAYLPLAGGTLTGRLVAPNIQINGNAGMEFSDGVTTRWMIRTEDAAGGNFGFHRYDAAGAYLGSPVQISNVSGVINTGGIYNNGALTNNGDITSNRPTTNTGYVFLGNTGANYLGFDGVGYVFPGAGTSTWGIINWGVLTNHGGAQINGDLNSSNSIIAALDVSASGTVYGTTHIQSWGTLAANALSTLAGIQCNGSYNGIGPLSLTYGNPNIFINNIAGAESSVFFQNNSLNRMSLMVSADAGANTGADFFIRRWDDAGAYLGDPLHIRRSDGNVAVGTTFSVGGTITAGGNISGWDITAGGSIVAQNLTASYSLNVAGPTTLAAATINGALSCTSTVTIYGATTNSGQTCNGALTVNGTGHVTGIFTAAQHSYLNGGASTNANIAAHYNCTGYMTASPNYTGMVNDTDGAGYAQAISVMAVYQPGVFAAVRLQAGNTATFDFRHDGLAFNAGGTPWQALSDARIKNVIADYGSGLAAINALRPVRYTYKGNDTVGTPANYHVGGGPKEGEEALTAEPTAPYPNSLHYQAGKDAKEFIGLVAQEAETAMPELVWQTTGHIDGVEVSDLRALNTAPLVFALINAVKELSAINNTLLATNELLLAEIAAIKTHVGMPPAAGAR